MRARGEALVRVGKFDAPSSSAAEWVRRYTDASANTTSAELYAYPAYDLYDVANSTAHAQAWNYAAAQLA